MTDTAKNSIEIARRRIPLKKLLNGYDIRTAAKNLEQLRLCFNEQEILLNAQLSVKWIGTDYYLIATRLETDSELAQRKEQARIAREAKLAREQKKLLQAQARAEQAAQMAEKAEEQQRKTDLELVKILTKKLGLTIKELEHETRNSSSSML